MTNLLLLGFLPSGSEWVIIALLIMLLFGGKKIPELMKGLGKGVKSFKDGVNEAKEEINKAKDDIEEPASKNINHCISPSQYDFIVVSGVPPPITTAKSFINFVSHSPLNSGNLKWGTLPIIFL